MKIWGAGISGLIAANIFQQAEVYEASTREKMVGHKALLRFRSTAVADAVGIDFRKVRVHKGLWDEGFVQPSILHANNYSRKVLGGALADRSVWDLHCVDRFIAPEDFVEQLIERCGDRIQWGHQVNALQAEFQGDEGPIISTIPMGVLCKLLGMKVTVRNGERSPTEIALWPRAAIEVRRWRIANADVHQTVYVSNPATRCYRVSITGDLLIAEYMVPAWEPAGFNTDKFHPFEPFGLSQSDCEELDTVKQQFGKIKPIHEGWRRQFILEASNQHNIFSLGRFGTWRNILLDDVVHDIAVIKRLIAEDAYGRSRHSAK